MARNKSRRKSRRGGNKPNNVREPKQSWSALFKKAPAPALNYIPPPPPAPVLERLPRVGGRKTRRRSRR